MAAITFSPLPSTLNTDLCNKFTKKRHVKFDCPVSSVGELKCLFRSPNNPARPFKSKKKAWLANTNGTQVTRDGTVPTRKRTAAGTSAGERRRRDN